MTPTRERIIVGIIFSAILLAFGAVYQFYIKPQLAKYAADLELKNTLEAKFHELETNFSGVLPEVLTAEWRAQVQPWTNAKLERARYFTFGDWNEHETPPKEGPVILKFWYDETSRKMLGDLYQRVAERLGNYYLFPADIRQNLEIPTLEQWQNTDVTEQMVNQALSRLAYGINLCKMLLDAKVTSVRDVRLWPRRRLPALGDLLEFQTAGLSFTITMRDFVNFMEQLRTADRFWTVEALKITYPYVAYPTEPQLQVDMLLTQAGFVGGRKAGAGGEAPAGAAVPAAAQAGGTPSSSAPTPAVDVTGTTAQEAYQQMMQTRPMLTPKRAQQQAEEPTTFLGKAWKWFKYYVLVMH